MIEQALPEAAHIIDIMSKILLFFGIAGLAVPLLQRLKMSPVLAYLLCGVIIGPYGLASFVDNNNWLAPLSYSQKLCMALSSEVAYS